MTFVVQEKMCNKVFLERILSFVKKPPKRCAQSTTNNFATFEENQRLQSVDRDKINNVVIWQVKKSSNWLNLISFDNRIVLGTDYGRPERK